MARLLLEEGLTRGSVNRSYYAMFYVVLALLASPKKETSMHSVAISLFDKDFVKTGVFPKELSRWLHDAFNMRQRADYAPNCIPSVEEAGEILDRAVFFVEEVRKSQTFENKSG